MKEVKDKKGKRKEAVKEIFKDIDVKDRRDAKIRRKCTERDGNDLGEIGECETEKADMGGYEKTERKERFVENVT